MQKAFLIYNPASGQRRQRRMAQIARVVQVFQSVGIQAEACSTTHPGSAVQQALEAVAAGFDTVIACGGDGTAHEALNGLMLASAGATLGVIPLGSGNLLATDLALPSDPETAARKLLTYQPRDVRPGVMRFQGGGSPLTRYFIIAAGVGADAQLMYRTAVEAKQRWGRNAYFLEMARMALHGRFPLFHVEWQDVAGICHTEQVTLVMAIRASRFPGLLRFVGLGSSLTQDDFRVMLFKTDKVRHFLNFFASLATGRNWRVPQIDLVTTSWFRCTTLPADERIQAEADGELLHGDLPVEVSIAPQTFKLLMPKAST